MNNKHIATMFFLMLISCGQFLLAQNIIISGRVVSIENSEPVPFTNIGVEGTFTGVAAKADGNFVLEINKKYKNDKVFFSAVGFKQKVLKAQEMIDKENIIKLEPLTYGIEDVKITTKSKVLYRIIRDATNSTGKNFIPYSYTANATYASERKNNNDTLTRKANVIIKDATGYVKGKNAYKNITYEFTSSKRNFDVVGLKEGATLMDHLLNFDIVRLQSTILDLHFTEKYDLTLIEETLVGRDSVWIIGYQAKNPTLSLTNDLYAKEFYGKVTIAKESYEVLKNEIAVKAICWNPKGRNVALEKTDNLPEVSYVSSIIYKKYYGKLAPEKIEYSINNGAEKIDAFLEFNAIRKGTNKMLSKRQYIENE